MKSLLHLRRLWILLCVPAALILTLCASNSTSFAEWYATTIYPVYASAVHAVMALAPFSVAEILILAAVAAVIVFLLLFLIRLIRNPEKRGLRAAKAGINLLCVGGALWFLFTISCGINYHRVPFSAVCGLTVQDSSRRSFPRCAQSLRGRFPICVMGCRRIPRVSCSLRRVLSVIRRNMRGKRTRAWRQVIRRFRTVTGRRNRCCFRAQCPGRILPACFSVYL